MRAFGDDVPEVLVLRTDNGPRYIARQFRRSMNLLGISLEYIQKHTHEDNGNIESFHSSLKTDYVWPFEFSDYREASFAIEKAFTDYNEKRPHSSIDYLPPREFRMKFLDDQSFREDYTRKLEARINEK
jgi:transposase InsO family protein